jgi:DMSO/TMAO reductase YedYZ molybdopterin-dependent catalytic subunit
MSDRVGITRRVSWGFAILFATLATLVAMLLQNVVRDTWQIRTLPERVMEWLLLFVPLDLFERGLARYGADAKEIALTGTVLGMALVLFLIGLLALRTGWSGWRLLGLGAGLWLLTMLVIMPITGAGIFATGLLVAPLLTNAGFLTVFLGYSSVLLAGAALASHSVGPTETSPGGGLSRTVTGTAERRALVAGLVGTGLAYALARVVGRDGGTAASSLPLALVPTRTAAPRVATPVAADTGTPQAVAAAPAATDTPAPARNPADAFPTPPPARRIARDKDGSLTAAGRPKGTLSPLITSNQDFYVVTKNAVADPVLDAANWRLVIDGEVNNPVQLDYVSLRSLPAVEITKTLECISNLTAGCEQTSFGCDLISTARWAGVRLSDLVNLAGGLKPGVVAFALFATDEFSAGLPVSAAMDPETLVVYEMNGEVLPREHGYPARLLVPGRYGMKNPKWLAGIRAMNQPFTGWYDQRGWNPEGFVKTMSRIDVPADGASLPAGQQQVAGIAYAGNRGIQKVEVSDDAGNTWQTAQFLEPAAGTDVMVRWQSTFTLDPGATATLVVRATDGTGDTQQEMFVLPQPNGGSGWDSIDVNAA